MKLIVPILSILLVLQPSALPAETAPPLTDQERAVVFVAQREALASHVETRTDVCFGIGATDLKLNEKGILAALKRGGLKFHTYDWCGRAPGGVTIAVLRQLREDHAGTYVFEVEAEDSRPIFKEGEHFARLLRKGNYTVSVASRAKPQLVTYEQTCCPEAKPK